MCLGAAKPTMGSSKRVTVFRPGEAIVTCTAGVLQCMRSPGGLSVTGAGSRQQSPPQIGLGLTDRHVLAFLSSSGGSAEGSDGATTATRRK